MVWAYIEAEHEQENWCTAHSGVYSQHTTTGYGITSNGKPGVTTSETDYCLTKDGRILKIWN